MRSAICVVGADCEGGTGGERCPRVGLLGDGVHVPWLGHATSWGLGAPARLLLKLGRAVCTHIPRLPASLVLQAHVGPARQQQPRNLRVRARVGCVCGVRVHA